MLCYHLFYSVRNKKKSYTETKCFMTKNLALEEAVKLCQCANVDLVTIRMVDVKSIELEVYKHPEGFETSKEFVDFSAPSLNLENLEIVSSSFPNFESSSISMSDLRELAKRTCKNAEQQN